MALISLRIRVSCPFDGPPSVPSVALYLSILTSFPSPTFSLCSKPRGLPATPGAQPGAPSLGPFLQIPKRLPSSPLVLKQWDALKRLLLTSPHGHPTGMSSMGTVISIPNLFFFPVFFFFFLGPHPCHMEIPRRGVQLELQLRAYTAATASRDPSSVCDLYHSSGKRQILNPMSEARDRTGILMDTRRVHFR